MWYIGRVGNNNTVIVCHIVIGVVQRTGPVRDAVYTLSSDLLHHKEVNSILFRYSLRVFMSGLVYGCSCVFDVRYVFVSGVKPRPSAPVFTVYVGALHTKSYYN